LSASVLIFASKDLGHPLTDLREVFNVWWRIIKSASNSYLFLIRKVILSPFYILWNCIRSDNDSWTYLPPTSKEFRNQKLKSSIADHLPSSWKIC